MIERCLPIRSFIHLLIFALLFPRWRCQWWRKYDFMGWGHQNIICIRLSRRHTQISRSFLFHSYAYIKALKLLTQKNRSIWRNCMNRIRKLFISTVVNVTSGWPNFSNIQPKLSSQEHFTTFLCFIGNSLPWISTTLSHANVEAILACAYWLHPFPTPITFDTPTFFSLCLHFAKKWLARVQETCNQFGLAFIHCMWTHVCILFEEKHVAEHFE